MGDQRIHRWYGGAVGQTGRFVVQCMDCGWLVQGEDLDELRQQGPRHAEKTQELSERLQCQAVEVGQPCESAAVGQAVMVAEHGPGELLRLCRHHYEVRRMERRVGPLQPLG
jgi:hypothetical protein